MWCAFSELSQPYLDSCVCLNISISLFEAVLWMTVGAPKPTKSCRRVVYLAVQAGTGTTLARRSGISSPLLATSNFAQLGTGRYPAQTKTSQRSLGYAPSTFTIRTFANRTYMWSTEKLEIPRGKCSLVEGALPKVFPNFPCQSQRRRCGNRSEKAMETLTKEQHHCSHKLLAAQFLPMPWSTICPSRPRRRLLKWNA